MTTIGLQLFFECPFCALTPGGTPPLPSDVPISLQNIPLGLGILCVQEATIQPKSPHDTWCWRIIKRCPFEETSAKDWLQHNAIAELAGADRKHLVWIPKPCGEVNIIGGEENLSRLGPVQTGVITQVTSVRWQRIRSADGGYIDSAMQSRFAGMWSQMEAAVLSGQRAGR